MRNIVKEERKASLLSKKLVELGPTHVALAYKQKV